MVRRPARWGLLHRARIVSPALPRRRLGLVRAHSRERRANRLVRPRFTRHRSRRRRACGGVAGPALGDERVPCRTLPTRPDPAGRRCRARASHHRRPGHEHRHRRCAQFVLEAGGRPPRVGRSASVGHLCKRTSSCRRTDSPPGGGQQPTPAPGTEPAPRAAPGRRYGTHAGRTTLVGAVFRPARSRTRRQLSLSRRPDRRRRTAGAVRHRHGLCADRGAGSPHAPSLACP